MKIDRLTIAGAAAAAIALTLAGCAGGTTSGGTSSSAAPTDAGECEPVAEFTTLEEGVLQAGGMNEMPGFLGVTDQGPFEGFNAEFMEMFAAENCVEIKWTPTTGAAGTLALTDKKMDVLAGMIIKSDARGEIFNQIPNELYFEAAGILSKEGWNTVDELKGKRVGIIGGSAFEQPLVEAVGDENVARYQASDQAYKDVVAGRIDAAFTNSVPQGWYVHENPDLGLKSMIIEEDPNHPLLTQQYEVNYLVMKGNDALSDSIADFYDRIREDGTLKEALAEYDITDEFYFNGR